MAGIGVTGFAAVSRPMLVVALVGAVSLLAAGCRRRPAGESPYADRVAKDIPQLEKALGVPFKRPPKLEVRSRQQVREFLLQKLTEPDVQKAITGQEATYKLLGLLPDTLKLSDFFVRVLTEQIIGYYDPKTKVLYVVEGAPDDYVGITIMHELVHALQDQYVNLDSLQHITADDDREAAIQSVIEGQAVFEQMFLMAGGGGNLAAQGDGGWEQIRAAIRDAQKTQPIFASAPMVIQESLLFPYINGADFVRRLRPTRRGKALWDVMPQTTEQVMHERASVGAAPDAPSQIVFPAVAGKIDENNFGEFGTRLFLYQHLKRFDPAIRGATGWDGDRYMLVKTPNGNVLVWVTVWDTPVEAAEFVSAMDDVMMARFKVKVAAPGPIRRYEARTRTVEISSRDVAGRPVVYYVDAPAGTSTTVVDLAKIQVTPR